MLKRSERQRFLHSEAERRMERWLVSDELKRFILDAEEPPESPRQVSPFIAISRQAGAGGAHIARMVARELGWDVLDKELLDFISARYQLPRDLLEYVDETKARFVHDTLRSFFTSSEVSQSVYLTSLERTLCLAAVHGKVVFVGRAAHCVLPRGSGLSVRIVAPHDLRVSWTMARRGMDRQQATRLVNDTDSGREELCKYYFHRDSHDALCFDLVINVERLTAEAATRQIVAAHKEIQCSDFQSAT